MMIFCAKQSKTTISRVNQRHNERIFDKLSKQEKLNKVRIITFDSSGLILQLKWVSEVTREGFPAKLTPAVTKMVPRPEEDRIGGKLRRETEPEFLEVAMVRASFRATVLSESAKNRILQNLQRFCKIYGRSGKNVIRKFFRF